MPGMASNLISGKKLRKKGLFHRNDHQALFTTKEDIGMVRSIGGLPHLVQDYNPAYLAAIHDEMEPPMALTASAKLAPSKATAGLWHLRAGHASERTLKLAAEHSNGIITTGTTTATVCSGCVQGVLTSTTLACRQ